MVISLVQGYRLCSMIKKERSNYKYMNTESEKLSIALDNLKREIFKVIEPPITKILKFLNTLVKSK